MKSPSPGSLEISETPADATHPLALSVINDGSTYTARVRNARTMTKRQYRQYLLGLVNAQARKERIEMYVLYKPKDVDRAVNDVEDHMARHMIDLDMHRETIAG